MFWPKRSRPRHHSDELTKITQACRCSQPMKRPVKSAKQTLRDRFNATVGKDWFLERRKLFSTYGFDAFQKYFKSRSDFDAFVNAITGEKEKDRFLKVASHYKFLVKEGRFVVPGVDAKNYFDEAYRFVGLVALIECVESSVSFKDFYEWLRKSGAFPIQNQQALDPLYEQYKGEFGVRHKMVLFFQGLDDSSKREIESWIKVKRQSVAIEKLAKMLYDIRSEFVHEARIIVDLGGLTTVSADPRHKGREITLTLEQVERVFERGVLLRFGYAAPASWPK
jgi:hypothetical protein